MPRYSFSILLPEQLELRSITLMHDGRYLVSLTATNEACTHGLSQAEFCATGFGKHPQEAAEAAALKSLEKLSKPLDELYVAQPRKERTSSKTPIANPLGKLVELLK